MSRVFAALYQYLTGGIAKAVGQPTIKFLEFELASEGQSPQTDYGILQTITNEGCVIHDHGDIYASSFIVHS